MEAFRLSVSVSGVESVALKGGDKDQVEVVGEGIDAVELTRLLRRKLGSAELLTVTEFKKESGYSQSQTSWSYAPPWDGYSQSQSHYSSVYY
ncbi:hypothetical protein M569_02548 [Genlisea aurea]|uniref:HMA domain-containing protein n=1 Tax=Genlisea aurea TaxID=192259 RepID=S8D4A1_9LAMI|nr:hypothetical protein M569_02548 [Genlisea aurea]